MWFMNYAWKGNIHTMLCNSDCIAMATYASEDNTGYTLEEWVKMIY